MTIYMMRGFPASGKSTYARSLTKMGIKRWNNDDFGLMAFEGRRESGGGDILEAVRNAFLQECLSVGWDVVVDDTNLHPRHEINLRRIAKEHDTDLYIVHFDAPIDFLVQRDSRRERPVGEQVIRDMVSRWEGKWKARCSPPNKSFWSDPIAPLQLRHT